MVLVLLFFPAWRHAAENRSSGCRRPCGEDTSCTKSSAKANGWSCSLQQWHPRRLGCGWLSNSYRPGSPTFLPEGNASYFTTVRGPNIFLCVIVSHMLHSAILTKCFVNTLCFHYWQNAFAGGMEWLCGPDLTRGPQFGILWYRLWRRVVTANTFTWVQHPRWLRRHGHKLLSRNTVTWQSVTDGRQHRTPATLIKAFHKEPGHIFSPGPQNVSLWNTSKIFRKFTGEWKFGLGCATARTETIVVMLRLWFNYFVASLFKALGIHFAREAKGRDTLAVGKFTTVSLRVYGYNYPSLPIFSCPSTTTTAFGTQE